ncbi:MAG: hypothetical protein OXI10_00150 [Gammaproteobacteria bacterium]|nr:hypothetical protein [Gammaproteobacteria bacterium]MYH89401.1 hypothetical protein [Gammaproteobacteria bacterium]
MKFPAQFVKVLVLILFLVVGGWLIYPENSYRARINEIEADNQALRSEIVELRKRVEDYQARKQVASSELEAVRSELAEICRRLEDTRHSLPGNPERPDFDCDDILDSRP